MLFFDNYMDTFETKLNSAFEEKFGLKTYVEANGKTLNITFPKNASQFDGGLEVRVNGEIVTFPVFDIGWDGDAKGPVGGFIIPPENALFVPIEVKNKKHIISPTLQLLYVIIDFHRVKEVIVFTPVVTLAIPDEAKSHLSEEQASALFEIPIEKIEFI
jgi:hypothetical protein